MFASVTLVLEGLNLISKEKIGTSKKTVSPRQVVVTASADGLVGESGGKVWGLKGKEGGRVKPRFELLGIWQSAN